MRLWGKLVRFLHVFLRAAVILAAEIHVRGGPARRNNPMKKKPILRICLLAALLLVGGGTLWLSGPEKLELANALPVPQVLPVQTAYGGVIRQVLVREGDKVEQGAVLAVMDNAEAQAEMARSAERLRQVAATIPPEHLPLGPDGKADTPATLGERLTQERKREAELAASLENMSVASARAEVAARKATALYRQGKISEDQLEEALANEATMKELLRSAKKEFEENSLKRAGTSADIQAMKGRGVDASMPLEMRVQEYRAQMERMQAARVRLEASNLRAPAPGVVRKVLVQEGASVIPGTVYLFMEDQESPARFVAEAAGADAGKVLPGMDCVVEFADGREARGRVTSVGAQALAARNGGGVVMTNAEGGAAFPTDNWQGMRSAPPPIPSTGTAGFLPVEVQIYSVPPGAAHVPFAPIVRTTVILEPPAS